MKLKLTVVVKETGKAEKLKNNHEQNKNNKPVFHDAKSRSSPLEVFLQKDVLKIFSKFTGEHPCRTAISIKLLCIKIALRNGCSPVNLLHIFRICFA